jgi:hypothetical protein
MQAQPSPLLEQLKDIHGAAEPPLWPPAPGWWLLAAVVLAVLLLLSRLLGRRLAVRRRKRAWLAELEQLRGEVDPEARPQDFLAGINRLFRAVAVRAFPGTACARLQGEEWVSFLHSLLPDGEERGHLSALAAGPYQPMPEFDADSLVDSARDWVTRYG